MAAFKVNITKNGNAIKFQFTDSDHYLYGNGEIEVPVNSLSLIVDESNMVTFRKANSNDIFLSFNPANSNLSDKEGVINFYKTNMVGSTGGGSESGITSGEVQTMIDDSLRDYYTDDEVDAALSGKASASDVAALQNEVAAKADTSDVTAVASDVSTLSGQVATKVNTTDFNAYSAATDARIAEDEEVTAAALNDLQENKADTSAVTAVNDALTAHTSDTGIHVTQADKTSWNAKAEPYSAGTGIEISGNVISATGGSSVTVDPTLDSGSTNPVANSAITTAIDNAKAYYISFATIATTGIRDEDWDGIVAAIDNHRPIYAGYPKNDGGILYYGVECMNKNVSNTQIVMTASDDNQHYFYTFVKNGSNDYSYTVDTRPYTTNQEKTAWNAKQDTLSAGTGIEISGNVISATGGGGATYSAGTNISIENDVISVNLPIEKKHFWNGDGIAIIGNANGFSDAAYSVGIGFSNTISASRAFILGSYCHAKAQYSVALNANNIANAQFSLAANQNTTTNNVAEAAFGTYNNSVTGSTASGNTLFSVGNGTAANARHNAFEIRQNGDIYVNDGTNDVRLQDTILALGGLKLVKLSQSEYDQLATKDPDTLYIITNVVS